MKSRALTTLCALALTLLMMPAAQAQQPELPRINAELARFYRGLAAAIDATSAGPIVSALDARVQLDLGQGTQRGSYTRRQASNVVGTYMRSISVIARSTKIITWSDRLMMLRFRFRDARGAVRQGQLYFVPRSAQGSFKLTSIRK